MSEPGARRPLSELVPGFVPPVVRAKPRTAQQILAATLRRLWETAEADRLADAYMAGAMEQVAEVRRDNDLWLQEIDRRLASRRSEMDPGRLLAMRAVL